MRVGRQGKNIEAESTVALLLHVNQVFSKILGWNVAHPVTQLPPPMGVGTACAATSACETDGCLRKA
jgi:hypothetical protein